jgi:hypothetical protein
MEEGFDRKITELQHELASKKYKKELQSAKQFCNSLSKKRDKRSVGNIFGEGGGGGGEIEGNIKHNLKRNAGESLYSTIAIANLCG